jgi:hypothetical protein
VAKKSGGMAKRLDRWTHDIRRWNGTSFTLGQHSIEALSKAQKHFGLDLENDRDRRNLLYILADIVFGVGKRGRPRYSKKWDYYRLLRLAEDRIEVERVLPKLSDRKAATEIKKRHPDRYKDTSAEMMRQMLREARSAHWWHGEEAAQAAIDAAREEWEAELEHMGYANEREYWEDVHSGDDDGHPVE